MDAQPVESNGMRINQSWFLLIIIVNLILAVGAVIIWLHCMQNIQTDLRQIGPAMQAHYTPPHSSSWF